MPSKEVAFNPVQKVNCKTPHPMNASCFSSRAVSVAALVSSAFISLAISPARAITVNNTSVTITSATTEAIVIASIKATNTGDLTITGSTAVVTGSTQVFVGSSGVGMLSIKDNASLVIPNNPTFYVGNAITGVGVLNVGTGGTIVGNTSSTVLFVGFDGVGTVNLDGGTDVGAYNGSSISVKTLQIGNNATASGTVNITNGGALTAPTKINVGLKGTGVMNLSNGSSASSDAGVCVALNTGGTGTLNVTLSSTISSASSIVVGDAGAGTMNLSGTSSAITTGADSSIIIGNTNSVGGSGTVTMDTNSTLNTPNLYVGKAANGTLTVANGASVSTTTFILGQNSGVSGVLNIGSTNGTDKGGTIITGTIAAKSGSGTINFNQTDGVSLSASIQGNINVNQTGSGISTLTGSNSYTGKTLVSNGALLVDGMVSASAIEVTGGVLGGNGTINGATIGANGTLAPGDLSLATPSFKLTSTGDITSAGTLAFTLNSTAEYSQLALSSHLLALNGGNLQLTVNYSLALGDQFKLITSGSASGAFSTLNGTTLVGDQAAVGGYTFQVIYNTGSDAVTLTVIAVPEPNTWALMVGAIAILVSWPRRRL